MSAESTIGIFLRRIAKALPDDRDAARAMELAVIADNQMHRLKEAEIELDDILDGRDFYAEHGSYKMYETVDKLIDDQAAPVDTLCIVRLLAPTDHWVVYDKRGIRSICQCGTEDEARAIAERRKKEAAS